MTMALTQDIGRHVAPIFSALNVPSSMTRGSTSPARADDRKEMRSTGHSDDAMLGLGEPGRTVAIASVLAAMVLVVLDAAIANIALPTIARSLHVTPAMSVWVITAYQTALLMALLPCAALGESQGRDGDNAHNTDAPVNSATPTVKTRR